MYESMLLEPDSDVHNHWRDMASTPYFKLSNDEGYSEVSVSWT